MGLVDDHTVFRDGLRALLSKQDDMEIVGEASNAREAYTMVERSRPDVVVIDISLPGTDGIAATRELLRREPSRKVLMLTMHEGEDRAAEALTAGAHGYVTKTQSSAKVIEAIRAVGRGERYVSPQLSQSLLGERMSRHGRGSEPLVQLTAREREIFTLLSRGLSNQAVANELCISIKTVETHRTHIHRKLGVHSVAELIHYAAARGLLR